MSGSHQHLPNAPASGTATPTTSHVAGTVPDAGRAFSTQDYFNTQRPPANLAEQTESMRGFVNRWNGGGKKVVLVTVSCET